MLLKQLIRDLPVKAVRGPLEREVLGIAYDIRRVTPGILYVAIPGEAVSGNESIPVAVDRGAIAVVCESEGFVPRRATRIDVASARVALGRAAAAYYGHPAGRLWMLGLAGGDGATEVACYLKQLLDGCGMPAGRVGALEDQVAGRVFRKQPGEFEALEFHHRLAGMVRGGCRACVVEVTGVQGVNVGDGVDFDAGIWVDLGAAGEAGHGGSLGRPVNRGVPGGRRALQVAVEPGASAQGGRVWMATVRELRGVSEGAEFCLRASEVRLGSSSSAFRLEWAEGAARVEVGLVGAFNVRACLAAFAIALGLGLAARAVNTAMSGLHAAPGRLQLVGSGRPVGVYVDGARRAEDLAVALRDLRESVSGRIVAVFGSRHGETPEARAALGRAAAQGANYVILTGDSPGKESVAEIADELISGFRDWRSDGWRVVLDRREAIGWGMRLALPGDAVLLAGKGHETVQQVAGTVVPFDDGLYASEWMERLGWPVGGAC